MDAKSKVGIVGTGGILWAYAQGCRVFDNLEIAACADIDRSKAEAKAKEFNIPRVMAVEELLADPEIEIVINLTVPKVHAAVTLQILEAGKHAYSEKPLGISSAEGRQILATAAAQNLRVGCAPDTFLGGGLQTCRKLIDDGAIGEPVAATAFMAGRGPEPWHPNPWFFYQPGGGPLFDMGPYYLTGLVSLLGPVRRVSGAARISFPERVAGAPEIRGQKIPVETPTHITGSLEFAAGAIGTLITSFDVWSHNLPRIEIYGSLGSLSVPDPNNFGGTVLLRQAEDKNWREIPLTHDADVQRGIGVADMSAAIRSGRPHRASGELAYHTLEIMESILLAAQNGVYVDLTSTCNQPAPLPLDLAHGKIG